MSSIVRGPEGKGKAKLKAEFQTLLMGYKIGGREAKSMTLPELQAPGPDWSNVS